MSLFRVYEGQACVSFVAEVFWGEWLRDVFGALGEI